MAPRKKTLAEKSWFCSDSETTNEGKNAALAALMDGAWKRLSVVSVERIEVGTEKGWRATYRE